LIILVTVDLLNYVSNEFIDYKFEEAPRIYYGASLDYYSN